MDIKVCDYCRKSIVKVDKKEETEGGIEVELKMLGNGKIRDRPFSKVFDICYTALLCDDCAKKLLDGFVECADNIITTKKPSKTNGKGEAK